MATTSSPIVLARFVSLELNKTSFHLILRPYSLAPDRLNFDYYEARLQSTKSSQIECERPSCLLVFLLGNHVKGWEKQFVLRNSGGGVGDDDGK